eukprot:scaffold1790_cov257-Pinguiococcus_pyrenoidosus.AAC.16
MALQCRHWLRRRCVPLLKLLNGSGAPRTQMSAAFLEKARSHKDRQTELLEAMSSGTADSSKISEYSIEISKLGRVVELYDRLQGLHDDAEVAQELAQEGSDELVDDLKEIQEEVEVRPWRPSLAELPPKAVALSADASACGRFTGSGGFVGPGLGTPGCRRRAGRHP